MFIRETIKKKAKSQYIQHQLVESIRTANGPRQRIILNLGTISLPKIKWKELANAIESLLKKQQQISLFNDDPEIINLAQHYTKLIIKDRLNKQNENSIKKEEPDYERVDINTLSTTDSRSIGCEHVVLNQLFEYKFDKILREIGFDEKQVDYAKMLITGRLVHPSSERETARWISENSSICELLGSKDNVYDNILHRTSVKIWANQDKIEQKLAKKAREIFNLKETIILYDLSNTYFESSKKDSDIAKFGRSKDKRNDRPIITLALTVDCDGFPKQSKILKGNISEPSTLKSMLDELELVTCNNDLQKTIVMDAGIATEENIKIIQNKKYKYIAATRKKIEPDFWKESKKTEISLCDKKTKLTTRLVRTDDEPYLLCYSPIKKEKESSILHSKLLKFENALEKINDGLLKKGTQKGYEKIIERLGRLKERYGVGSLYEIKVEEKNKKAIKINFKKNPKGKAKELNLGKYILRTNRNDLNNHEISKIYRSLCTIEDSFRSIKSHLGLRPNFHQTDRTCLSHMFISVIAYHIQIGILKKLQKAGIYYNWTTIRNILSNHERVTTSFKIEDGSVLNVRTCTIPSIKQKRIYDALNIKQQPLKRIKTKIPLKHL